MSEKVLVTLRQEHLKAIDDLVRSGAASSRSEMIDKIVGGFLADLKAGKQNNDTALGNLAGFLLLLLGIAAVAKIFGDEK